MRHRRTSDVRRAAPPRPRPRRRARGLAATAGAAVVLLAPAVHAAAAAPALARALVPAPARATSKVVVLLADQHGDLPADGAHRARREQAIHDDQAPLLRQVTASGGRDVHSFSIINGFSAAVSPAEAAKLAKLRQVSAVIPDAPVHLGAVPGSAYDDPSAEVAAAPRAAIGGYRMGTYRRGAKAPDARQQPRGAAGPGDEAAKPAAAPTTRFANLAAASAAGVCPATPTAPMLEPEALSLTHTADADPSVPQAQSLVDGQGVKVAFIADGLDVRNPDLLRPDGTPVITDHQNFTGEGDDAQTGGAEAFGDASAIAAQGNRSYDLSDFVNAASPLPSGCTIRIRGVAPGASLVALDVFGGATAPSSTIVQAIDHAVTVDHVDVINESFGGNPVPDFGLDPVALADDAAVAAGVTVVASSGDSGQGGTVGTPASDPAVISVGATTSLRAYAQTGERGFGFSRGSWASDNISTISSGGVDEAGRSIDLVAPGDLGWALCGDDLSTYQDCVSNRAPQGQVASPIQEFGGTSQAAPLTSGAAALVIEAYEKTHGGAHPSPALVKQILTSTADDLGLPGADQGAGLLDSLAAVRMAESVHTADGAPASTGDGLELSGQLATTAAPGTTADLPLTVTNTSPRPQVVRAAGRVPQAPTAIGSGTVTLNATAPDAPSFTDQLGRSRAYVKQTFDVPAGADILDAAFAFHDPSGAVYATLIDPRGVYQQNSLPQGSSDYARLRVRHPAAGRWTAVLYAAAAPDGFDGPVHYDVSVERNAPYGTATPAQLRLAPGASGTFHLAVPLPAAPGDLAGAVTLDTDTGLHAATPLTLRSLIVPDGQGGAFDGVLTGGNGRGAPATTSFWQADVPPGRHDISVGLTLTGSPSQDLYGVLVDPNGQTVASTASRVTKAAGGDANSGALQLYHRDPMPGRWTVVVFSDVLGTGVVTAQRFDGRVAFDTVRASARGLPADRARLAAGKPVKVTVTVTNTGVAPGTYFVDPRLTRTGALTLSPIAGTADKLDVPVSSERVVPVWQVPPESTGLTVTATGTRPVTLDLEAGAELPPGGQPEVYAPPDGNTATASLQAADLTPGAWYAVPGIAGADPAKTTATVDLTASVTTQLFDPAATTSTGDFWAESVVPDAPAATGLDLAPGGSGSIVVTITPRGRPGTTVDGVLYVDDFSRTLHQGDELAAIPYRYTVG